MGVTAKRQPAVFSIRVRILCALLSLVAMQGIVLSSLLFFTGVIKKNNNAAYNVLSSQTYSKKKEFEKTLNNLSENIGLHSETVNKNIEKFMEENGTTLDEIDSDSPVYENLLRLVLDDLISFTKYDAVTGAFFVFDPSEAVANETKLFRSCIYIRDSAPHISLQDNKNILLEYGPASVRDLGISLNYLWNERMSFSSGHDRDFYFVPIKTYLDYKNDGGEEYETVNFGYWTEPFTMKKDDVQIITYSIPMVGSNGKAYGVLGFELEAEYVSRMILSYDAYYYMGLNFFGKIKDGGLYNDSLVTYGTFAGQFLAGERNLLNFKLIYKNERSDVYEINNPNISHLETVGAYTEILMYDEDSAFFGEKWAFVCAAPESSVLASSNDVINAIIIAVAISVLLNICFAFYMSEYIFDPIRRFNDEAKKIDPEKLVRFERTGIREIDELSATFEVLSDGVSEAAAKMFKIIEMVEMPLGSFEIVAKERRVVLSGFLLELLKTEKADAKTDDTDDVSLKDWIDFIESLVLREGNVFQNNKEGVIESLYSKITVNGESWYKIRLAAQASRTIGVLIDVTEEIALKQKLEFERDYDPLTKLLNRQAFVQKAYENLNKDNTKIGLMMFADLDDLKFLNDLHGHQTGDIYIRRFADFISSYKEFGGVVGRLSGDEFVMFMTGFSSRKSARQAFDSVYNKISDSFISVPDGTIYKTRASVGLSFYPDDAVDINELIKFSDYAMYEIKHSVKGGIKEFNIESYNENSFVYNMKNVLDLLIDEKRIRFAFQPIVDVRTGDVYAYEALMRPTVREIKSPDEVLSIARSQSKLYQIEKLTFHVLLDWFQENKSETGGKVIFLNTIPSQRFTSEDLNEILYKYKHLFDRIVFEITENEFSKKEDTKRKMDVFRQYGGRVAIDDYGSGYSNEVSLLFMEPDFVKIDMNIVRSIDKDADRQQLARGIISYTSKKGIKIIAEGVETFEELKTLVSLGVDYIQGYYFAKPNFELIDISDKLKKEVVELAKE